MPHAGGSPEGELALHTSENITDYSRATSLRISTVGFWNLACSTGAMAITAMISVFCRTGFSASWLVTATTSGLVVVEVLQYTW